MYCTSTHPPSTQVFTSLSFVVSDKVRSRGKGYLSIFFLPAVPLPQNDYRYLSSSGAHLSGDFGICWQLSFVFVWWSIDLPVLVCVSADRQRLMGGQMTRHDFTQKCTHKKSFGAHQGAWDANLGNSTKNYSNSNYSNSHQRIWDAKSGEIPLKITFFQPCGLDSNPHYDN